MRAVAALAALVLRGRAHVRLAARRANETWAHVPGRPGLAPVGLPGLPWPDVDPPHVHNLARGARCAACARWQRRLLLCGRCRRVRYCSRRCQKREWNLGVHRAVCD